MEIKSGQNMVRLLTAEVGNMTLLQVGILLAVMAEPGITMPELEKRFKTTRATVSRSVDKLREETVFNPETGKHEIMGLLRTDGSRDDVRIFSVSLTKKGEELMRKLVLLR